MNKVYKYILLVTGLFIFGVLAFTVLMRLPDLSNTIFFYKGIRLLIISSVVLALMVYFLKEYFHIKIINIKDLVYIPIVFFCIMLVFFTHVPVTADRSLTVFMLGVMDKESSKEFTVEEMQEIFTNKYQKENGNIEKRFDEQIVSGNVQVSVRGYQITKKGKELMKFYNFIADLFLIDKTNLSR